MLNIHIYTIIKPKHYVQNIKMMTMYNNTISYYANKKKPSNTTLIDKNESSDE
jgi:hypothetical protein